MFYPQIILNRQLILLLHRHILLHRQFIFSLTPMIPLIFFLLSLCRCYLPPFAVYLMLNLHTIIIWITLLTNGLRLLSLSFSYLYRRVLSTLCPLDWLSVTENATVESISFVSMIFWILMFFLIPEYFPL